MNGRLRYQNAGFGRIYIIWRLMNWLDAMLKTTMSMKDAEAG